MRAGAIPGLNCKLNISLSKDTTRYNDTNPRQTKEPLHYSKVQRRVNMFTLSASLQIRHHSYFFALGVGLSEKVFSFRKTNEHLASRIPDHLRDLLVTQLLKLDTSSKEVTRAQELRDPTQNNHCRESYHKARAQFYSSPPHLSLQSKPQGGQDGEKS